MKNMNLITTCINLLLLEENEKLVVLPELIDFFSCSYLVLEAVLVACVGIIFLIGLIYLILLVKGASSDVPEEDDDGDYMDGPEEDDDGDYMDGPEEDDDGDYMDVPEEEDYGDISTPPLDLPEVADGASTATPEEIEARGNLVESLETELEKLEEKRKKVEWELAVNEDYSDEEYDFNESDFSEDDFDKEETLKELTALEEEMEKKIKYLEEVKEWFNR
jgi:hypothetical protein